MDLEYAKNTIIEQKNCPFFKVSANQLTVFYTGRNLAYVDYTSVQSSQPARKEDFIYYYECTVDQKGQSQNDLCIGFADKDFPPNKMPGFTSKYGSSYGYMSSGTLYTGKHPVLTNLPKFEKKDIIGCGINYFTKEIFFTVNGKLIAGIRCEEQEIREFYATVGLHGIQTQITFNFGKKEFAFNLQDYIEEEKKKGVSSVMENELPVYQIHQIVHSYLYFQGYFDTLKEFENACQLDREKVFLIKNENQGQNLNKNQFMEKLGNIQKICQNQQQQLQKQEQGGDMELETQDGNEKNVNKQQNNQDFKHIQNKKSIEIEEEEESKYQNEKSQDIKQEENENNRINDNNYLCNKQENNLQNNSNIRNNNIQNQNSNNGSQKNQNDNIKVKIEEIDSQVKIEDFNNYQMTNIEENDKTQQQQETKQEPYSQIKEQAENEEEQEETQQFIKKQKYNNGDNQNDKNNGQRNLNNENQVEEKERKNNNNGNQNSKNNSNNRQNNSQQNHTMYFVNENSNTSAFSQNSNNNINMPQFRQNNNNNNNNNNIYINSQNSFNKFSGRKMTDDFNLVKERMRSDSFNKEFDLSHSFFKKDSIDFNYENSFTREFSNNFNNIDSQTMNQMILGSQSNIFMGVDIQKKNIDEVQENLIQNNKDQMEKHRGQIRQMIIQGDIEKVIDHLNQVYPSILEQREDIKAILYYQNFLQKISQEKIMEGIQFVQENIKLLENKSFMIYDDKGQQQYIEFKKVLGVISFSDLNDPEIKQFFDKKQKFLVSDLVNQAILCYMGYSEQSVMELLIKQLILIQERFREDNTGFGNVFQFSV